MDILPASIAVAPAPTRNRKRKAESSTSTDISANITPTSTTTRKTKASKIVDSAVIAAANAAEILAAPAAAPTPIAPKSNVVLHLKCFVKDLGGIAATAASNSLAAATQHSTSNSSLNQFFGKQLPTPPASNAAATITADSTPLLPLPASALDDDSMSAFFGNVAGAPTSQREIARKLRALETQLHHNNVNQHSACFWCTCSYDNPTVYIPKFTLRDVYHVYGNFCSPECAAAHLLRQPIDTSVKFEQFALLNFLYGKVYGYAQNICPAPDPHYLLDKFCGNLTIDEYRALHHPGATKHVFVVEKPLTKIMPELHQNGVDVLSHNKLLSSTHL